MGGVGPHRLGNQNAPPQAFEQPGVQPHGTARAAKFYARAIRDAGVFRVLRMDQHRRAPFPRERSGGLGEGGVQEIARRAGREPERIGGITLFGHRPMIREARHGHAWPDRVGPRSRSRRPVRTEAEAPVRPAEPVEEMRLFEGLLAVDPAALLQFGQGAAPGLAQGLVDDHARAHVEGRMPKPEPARQTADDFVVAAALARRLDQLRPEQDVLLAAALVHVVVLDEHGRRQNDVGHAGRIGHDLLVDDGEKVFAGKPAPHHVLVGRHHHRIGVLDEQRRHGRTAEQRFGFAGQHRADARLVEPPGGRVAQVQPFDQSLVPAEHAGIRMQGAAALVSPAAQDHRDRTHRMQRHRSVARPCKTVADAEERFRALAEQPGQGFDIGGRHAADRRCPFGRTALQMGLEAGRIVRIAGHVVAVGQPIPEQHVHDGAGERAIRAGPHQDRDIGLTHGRVVVDVDRHDRRSPALPGSHRVGHHIDLGHGRVGAPEHDAVGVRHLARIGAAQPAVTGQVAGPGQRRADRRILVGIALGVPQAVDAVAHHEAHRAGVVIGPDSFRPETPFRLHKALGDAVEGFFDRNRRELPRSLGAGPHQGLGQPVRIVDAFGIARDLGADHPGRVAVVLRPIKTPDRARVEDLHLERAGRGTVVRARRGTPDRSRQSIHGQVSGYSHWVRRGMSCEGQQERCGGRRRRLALAFEAGTP